MAQLRIKRVREPASGEDGVRILVDRLWPRGVSRARAHLHHWFKGLAPSTGLRTWFGHEPARFEGFARRYAEELERDESGDVAELRSVLRDTTTATLVYDAGDEQHNNAVVLLHWLREHRSGF